jgi:hypothetical protein
MQLRVFLASALTGAAITDRLAGQVTMGMLSNAS